MIGYAVHTRPYVASTDREPHTTVPAATAAQTLARFVVAVREGDAALAASLAPRDDARTATLLGDLVRNADALRVRGFSLRYVDEAGGEDAAGSWLAAASATWTFAGVDRSATRTEIDVRLVREGARVALAGFGGGERRQPVWLSGPVRAERGPGYLIVDAGRGGVDAERLAGLARRALPVVRRVWPAWHGPLVIEVPTARIGLDGVLGAAPGEYDNIAAVTTSLDGATAPDAPVHVFVNAALLGRLRPVGAQVVVSHEATHVATDAAGSAAPAWLLEGFADYVALRDVDLPLSVTAARLAAVVARDGVPDALPDAAALAPSAPDLEAAYEASWLVCRTIAEQAGEAALVRFYRAVDAGEEVGAALPRTTGLRPAALTRRWQERLAHLPR